MTGGLAVQVHMYEPAVAETRVSLLANLDNQPYAVPRCFQKVKRLNYHSLTPLSKTLSL